MNTIELKEIHTGGLCLGIKYYANNKKGAKQYSDRKLADYMIENFGYEPSKARIIAYYLKGNATYQMACDAE